MNDTLTIPDLEFRNPDCPRCHQEVAGDGDSWWCEHCGITWSHDGTGGQQ